MAVDEVAAATELDYDSTTDTWAAEVAQAAAAVALVAQVKDGTLAVARAAVAVAVATKIETTQIGRACYQRIR